MSGIYKAKDKMQIGLVDLQTQYRSHKDEIDAAIRRVVESAAFIGGELVEQFELSFAEFCGGGFVAGVASGTSALYLALRALKIGVGDEVITVPNTFIATAEAISLTGAKVVFVDIDSSTLNLDPNLIEAAITPATKAIIPVHLFGLPCKMDSLMSVAKQHNLLVIEDAAQAHGAQYREKTVGLIGHAGCFSFFPSKNLGAFGDAGAVISTDELLIKKIRMSADHGREGKYTHTFPGLNARLDALQAEILRVKLKWLAEGNKQRRRAADYYSQALAQTGDLITPTVPPGLEHVFHLYVIRTAARDRLKSFLAGKGIGCGIHYPVPLHLQPAYRSLSYTRGVFPHCESAANEILSLPIFPEITREQQDYIIDNIKEFYSL